MAALMRRVRRINNRPVLGTAEKVIIHNISCSGLGLLSQRPVMPQENLCISILSEGEETVPPLVTVVVYCHELQDGWFTLGLKLYQPLSSEMINKIKSPKFVRHINTLSYDKDSF
jgi:hypothetical protein